MATKTYKCDVCKRTIQNIENPQGLTNIGFCRITEGCKGSLQFIERNAYSARVEIPASVEGLVDFTPRKKLYTHNQFNPKKSWTVDHNLLTMPVVEVFAETESGTLIKVSKTAYSTESINSRRLKISLDVPTKGVAQCIARTTTNDDRVIPEIKLDSFQVTTDRLFTFAIPKKLTTPIEVDLSLVPIRILVEVSIPDRDPVQCVETIQPKLFGGAWLGWNDILLRKRRNFIVRTKSISDFSALHPILTTGGLPEGTRIRFLQVDFGSGYHPIDSKTIIVLVSKSPHRTSDKIQDKLIDLGEILNTTSQYFTFRDGEFHIPEAVVESTYPNIVRDVRGFRSERADPLDLGGITTKSYVPPST